MKNISKCASCFLVFSILLGGCEGDSEPPSISMVQYEFDQVFFLAGLNFGCGYYGRYDLSDNMIDSGKHLEIGRALVGMLSSATVDRKRLTERQREVLIKLEGNVSEGAKMDFMKHSDGGKSFGEKDFLYFAEEKFGVHLKSCGEVVPLTRRYTDKFGLYID